MSTPVFDVTDLKERISQLKETQRTRILERQQVEVKLVEKENLLQKMKQDYSILQPNLELRYHNSTTSAATSVVLSQGGTPSQGRAMDPQADDRSQRPNAVHLDEAIVDKELVDDQRFRVWNEKLEMQILLQEIRQTIPNLEKQAKIYEKQTASHKKHVLKREMKTPTPSNVALEDQVVKPSLLLTFDECSEMIEKTMKEIIDYKVAKRVKIEAQKQANQALLQKLNFVRKDIQQKLAERAALRKIVLKYQKDFLVQRHKALAVQRDFLELRRICEEKGQYLWQTAIFTEETGSENGRLHFERLVPVLSKWLVVRNKEVDWTTDGYLSALIRDIQSDNSKYVRKRLSKTGRDSSEGKESKEDNDEGLPVASSARPIHEEGIDLVTFCLICQNLILRLE